MASQQKKLLDSSSGSPLILSAILSSAGTDPRTLLDLMMNSKASELTPTVAEALMGMIGQQREPEAIQDAIKHLSSEALSPLLVEQASRPSRQDFAVREAPSPRWIKMPG